MASKKSNNNKSGDVQAKRRMRVMQIIFMIFSLMLVISMILSAFITTR